MVRFIASFSCHYSGKKLFAMLNPFLFKSRTANSPLAIGRQKQMYTTKQHMKLSKPPNILLYCPMEDQESVKTLTSFVEVCLAANQYTVYSVNSDVFYNDPWIETTTLLVLWNSNLNIQNLNMVKLNARLQQYLGAKGKILSFMPSVMQDVKFCCVETDVSKTSEVIMDCGNFVVKCWSGIYLEQNLKQTVVARILHKESKHIVATINSEKTVVTTSLPLLDLTHNDDATDTVKVFKSLLQMLMIRISTEQETVGILKNTNNVPEGAGLLFATSINLQNQFLSWFKLEPPVYNAGGLKLIPAVNYQKTDLQHEEFLSQNSFTVGYSAKGDPSGEEGVCCDFNWQCYRDNLKSDVYGHHVVYADVIGSTMTVFDGLSLKLPERSGVVAIAKQQTKGQGRGGNKWLSPVGCAMFTLVVVIPVASKLGKTLPFIQHITAVAVVHAIREMPGLGDVDLRVKWPNDIHFGSSLKLGGVVVKSTMFRNNCIASIGCGVNIANERPTVCVNQILEDEYHIAQKLQTEEVIARTLTALEKLIFDFQKHGSDQFLELYYKYWLHSGSYVNVQLEKGSGETLNALVAGVDDCGYLRVRLDDGSVKTLHPDGNSFDLTKNLVIPKR